MTTMRLVAETGAELPSQRINKRIRGLMAENAVTGVQLAAAIGMDQAAFSRRYRGKTDWSFDEVARVAEALGTSLQEIVSYALAGEVVRHQGLEPRTRWLTVCPDPDHTDSAAAA